MSPSGGSQLEAHGRRRHVCARHVPQPRETAPEIRRSGAWQEWQRMLRKGARAKSDGVCAARGVRTPRGGRKRPVQRNVQKCFTH